MLGMVHLQYSSGGLNVLPPRETVPKATAAAERALELDPANSDAHATLAGIGVFHERDWPKVFEHSRKAVELDPSAAMAHAIYAYYLSISRRFDEAIAEIEKAVVLDPLAPMMTENAAWHCYHARDFERARAYCQKAFNLAPDFAWAHFIVGLIEVQFGRLDQARAAFERGRGTGFMNGYIGYALAAMGDHEGARGLLEEVARDIASGRDSSYSEALIHFGNGDTQRCLDALQAMTDESPAILVVSAWLNVDPFWDPLRSDPHFQDLLRRMNFPE